MFLFAFIFNGRGRKLSPRASLSKPTVWLFGRLNQNREYVDIFRIFHGYLDKIVNIITIKAYGTSAWRL